MICDRYESSRNLLTDGFDLLSHSKVLVVGAGGIGCELLKTLVMTGFLDIEIVDLDTIDLSNLNRQFLFQKRHIKQSKAKIARESALQMNPDARIQAHHASIFEAKFDVAWFKSFKLVLNALDNVAARRYVNLMCLAANVPLIESGTAGYLGQVSFHEKNHTNCYDCSEKPTTKTYPVCTIRNTPSLPIHCIVWAKTFLFNQLLGEDDDEELDDTSEEHLLLKQESIALAALKETMGQPGFEQQVFAKVFQTDVERLLLMENLWKDRTPPIPIDQHTLKGTDPFASMNGLEKDQNIWTLEQNYHVFIESLTKLANRLVLDRKADVNAALSFDKDDAEALDFVTASSNLRSHIYGIELKSRFHVKEMAGNIIPAIATTNAIISGLIVLQAVKVVCGRDESKKDTFLVYQSKKDRFLFTEAYPAPNPLCTVCQCTYVLVVLDVQSASLSDLKALILRRFNDLNACEEISIEEGGRILYDPDFTDNEEKELAELNIKSGSILTMTIDHPIDPRVYYLIKIIIKHDQEKESMEYMGDTKLYPLKRVEPEPSDNQGAKRKIDEVDGLDEESKNKKRVVTIQDDDGIIEL